MSEHYRTWLNNVAQQWGYTIAYEATSTGPQHRPQWTSKVYLNNIENGRGSGGSRGSAKEQAAKSALIALGFIRQS
ncbi:hypothetical protein B0H14DRAFT_2677865 [Mycena olivaceomarginata]|uniref:DRBM domain-containing protein n=1 Tax=Mycena albidolilacea TaxID=1033008 RepID=A0AAD7ALI5_9AGAR|nr:hypothetical protein DFH08DRAFT_843634 [Mycena albidolilacea]KAJ7897338.1 hypothetical protein B0H14DRAFT_2677865 [Mycena olivaceomarginata]